MLDGDPIVHTEGQVVGMARETEVWPTHARRLLGFHQTDRDVADPICGRHLRATVDDDLGEVGLGDRDGTFQRDAERLWYVEPDGCSRLFGRGAHDDAALLCRSDRDHSAEDDDPDALAVDVAHDLLQCRLRRGILQRVVHGSDLPARL